MSIEGRKRYIHPTKEVVLDKSTADALTAEEAAAVGTYAEGEAQRQALLVRIVGAAIELAVNDLQIGAVEFKDGASDNRATVTGSGELKVLATGVATETTLAALKVVADTLGTEATLSAISTKLDSLGTEATLDVIKTTAQGLASESTLDALKTVAQSLGTETTLALVKTNLDTLLSTVATNAAEATPGATAATKIIQMGGIAQSAPITVEVGQAVAQWLDTYGRTMIFGSNLAQDAINVVLQNAAELMRLGPITNLDAVTATGAGNSVDVSMYKNFSLQVIAGGTADATVTVEHSIDGTNWFVVETFTIAADGNSQKDLSNKSYKYLRFNIPTYTSGTFTCYLYAGN